MPKENSFSTPYTQGHTKFNIGKSILSNSRYIIWLDKQVQTELDVIRLFVSFYMVLGHFDKD